MAKDPRIPFRSNKRQKTWALVFLFPLKMLCCYKKFTSKLMASRIAFLFRISHFALPLIIFCSVLSGMYVCRSTTRGVESLL
jgi:hypothetical protein